MNLRVCMDLPDRIEPEPRRKGLLGRVRDRKLKYEKRGSERCSSDPRFLVCFELPDVGSRLYYCFGSGEPRSREDGCCAPSREGDLPLSWLRKASPPHRAIVSTRSARVFSFSDSRVSAMLLARRKRWVCSKLRR